MPRGDVYRSRFPRGTWHEQHGDRYGVVVQADEFLNDVSTVYSVVFSPDGQTLASGNGASQVMLLGSSVWGSTFGELRRQLCSNLGGATITHAQWTAYAPDQPYQRTCP